MIAAAAIERPASAPHLEAMFRVASYNIRRGLGTDLRRNLHRNLAVLKEIDADVVAVQEADPVLGELFEHLPASAVAAESDYTPVTLGTARGDISWHGNVVLVRRTATILDVHRIALPSFEEQRGAAVVDLALGGRRLRVVAMHLGLLGKWRARQALALLERVETFATHLPTVMLGDLNEWHGGGACLAHFGRKHHVASPGRSFPSRLPLLALDKIVINPELRLVDAGVHDSALARKASDHLPVWASLSLAAPAAATP